MDQRARGDVLEAVAHAAYEVPDDHEAEEEPERRDELAEALDNDPDERRGPKPRQRHPTRDDVRAHELPIVRALKTTPIPMFSTPSTSSV
jgi:hypothetical protein